MDIKIGTILTLEPMYTENVEKLRCKVVEADEGVLFIDYPINVMTNKTAFLVDGSQFRVTFHTEQKINYAFNTEVLGRRAGNVPMIQLLCPPKNEFIKIQRREFVRVATPVDIAIEHNGHFMQFVSEDISAGGSAVILKGEVGFEEGQRVQLTVVLPFANRDIYYIRTEGYVVRIFEREGFNIASIQFTDTDDLDKQHLVRFCFERQLMARKKEIFQS